MQTARRIITVEGVAMAWAEHGSGMRGAAFGVLVSGDLLTVPGDHRKPQLDGAEMTPRPAPRSQSGKKAQSAHTPEKYARAGMRGMTQRPS